MSLKVEKGLWIRAGEWRLSVAVSGLVPGDQAMIDPGVGLACLSFTREAWVALIEGVQAELDRPGVEEQIREIDRQDHGGDEA